MKYILVAFLLLVMLFMSVRAALGTNQSPFVAVICTKNRAWMWQNYPKYRTDYFATPLDWDELPEHLKNIRSLAGSRPIVLDFHVHGCDDGLYLTNDKPEHSDRASMGWVLLKTCEGLQGLPTTIMFESCYAGRAYKNTIRGAVMHGPYDNIASYPTVPPYPVYGLGDSFSGIGQFMYIQLRHNFRKYWVNLVDYDPKGANRALLPVEPEPKGEYSKTTAEMDELWEMFSQKIP